MLVMYKMKMMLIEIRRAWTQHVHANSILLNLINYINELRIGKFTFFTCHQLNNSDIQTCFIDKNYNFLHEILYVGLNFCSIK